MTPIQLIICVGLILKISSSKLLKFEIFFKVIFLLLFFSLDIVKKSKLGDGYIYSFSSKKYLNLCLDLLTKNQFALIKRGYYLKKIK